MRAIIIGAGRGRRLMPATAGAPKCFAKVQGKRILDWGLEALAAAGIRVALNTLPWDWRADVGVMSCG